MIDPWARALRERSIFLRIPRIKTQSSAYMIHMSVESDANNRDDLVCCGGEIGGY